MTNSLKTLQARTTMKIKVAIVDDHAMVLAGLRQLLSKFQSIEITGLYEDGMAFVNSLPQHQPDVLLLDLHLPNKMGDKLVPKILRKYPEIKIIALTSLDSSFYIYNLIQEGASGYLLKNTSIEKIVEAIETVYSGSVYMEKELKDKMESFAQRIKSREALNPTFTQKEKEVLKLTAQGLTLQEIGEQLFLSQRTVEYYRTNLLLKMDVKNMVELVRKSIETGLID